MRFRLLSTSILSVSSAVVLVACSDSTGTGDPFVIQGSVQIDSGEPLPANTRLVVAWIVSAGSPDYSYVFGEGTIDSAAGTFELALTDPPPGAALNAGVLGVGIIVALTNASVSTGDDLEDVPEADFVGAAGRFGVIYVADPDAEVLSGYWAEEFGEGYGVGEGMEVQGSFDVFVPVDPSSVVLVIDDLGNIDFVNWT